MLGINGLEAPAATEVAHRQLTTGDPGRFREIAARMFGDEFPDVSSIDLAVVAR